MANVKVSIVTTVYKAEKDLPRLLDSMKAVQNQDIEFFLIDNGSPDNSYEICKKYAEDDSRFTIYRIEENIGYIRARNVGIENCSGNYVGFCDSDDFLEIGGYDKAIETIKETNPDFYIGAYNLIDNKKVALNLPPFEEGLYGKDNFDKISPHFFGWIREKAKLVGFVWKNLYKKDILIKNNIRFNEALKPYEDQIFNLDMLRASDRVYADTTVLYNYIVNAESITAKLISDFSVKAECQRVFNLYSEYNERIANEDEKIALCNYMMGSIYSIFLNCAKSKEKVKNLKKEIENNLDKNFIKHVIKYCSKNQSINIKLVKFFLRFRAYKLLLKVIRFSLKNKKEL